MNIVSVNTVLLILILVIALPVQQAISEESKVPRKSMRGDDGVMKEVELEEGEQDKQPLVTLEEVISDRGACPDLGTSKIQVEQYRGRFYINHEKSAFELAREKSRRYDEKMPIEQGNLGHPDFRTVVDIKMQAYPSTRCVALETLSAKIEVNNRIEIAKEFDEGSCVYAELYNLELELMQLDEEIINNELIALKGFLRENFGRENTFGPVTGQNIDGFKDKKTEMLEWLVKSKVFQIREKIYESRKEYDVPEYYEEILTECGA